MSRTYGYYNLCLVDGKLNLPLKFFISSETDTKLPTKQGKNGIPIKTIKVLPISDSTSIDSIEQIKEVIPWSEVETYLSTSDGKLKKIDEFPGLSELMKKNDEKKKDRDIEVLGIYAKNNMPWKYFNGRQFHTTTGVPKQKTQNTLHMQLYQCLANLLKNDYYILIRFFTRSGQELGAMYEDGGYLKISGLHSDIELKQIDPLISVVDDENIKELFNKKIFEKHLKYDKMICELDWNNYYNAALEKQGVFNTYSVKKREESVSGDNLINILNSL